MDIKKIKEELQDARVDIVHAKNNIKSIEESIGFIEKELEKKEKPEISFIFDKDNYLWGNNDHLNCFPCSRKYYGKGRLPKGLYKIKKPIKLKDCEKNIPYRDIYNNYWFCPIEPMFKTDRSGLGIHPDGNLPGTLGCIGVRADYYTLQLFYLLSKHTGGILEVL
jgi:hypothetical protein